MGVPPLALHESPRPPASLLPCGTGDKVVCVQEMCCTSVKHALPASWTTKPSMHGLHAVLRVWLWHHGAAQATVSLAPLWASVLPAASCHYTILCMRAACVLSDGMTLRTAGLTGIHWGLAVALQTPRPHAHAGHSTMRTFASHARRCEPAGKTARRSAACCALQQPQLAEHPAWPPSSASGPL